MSGNPDESQIIKPPSPRSGLRRLLLAVIVLAAAAIVVYALAHNKQDSGTLHCYVGGTMGPVFKDLADRWLKKTGQKVELDISDSGQAIVKLQTAKKGDLIVVHDPFHGQLANEGLSVGGWHIASLTPVMVVKKGNPRGIKAIADVDRDDVKLIYTHPVFSTLGHIMPIVFRKAGLDPRKMQDKAVSLPRSGAEAANAVILGKADAGFCWDAVAFLRSKDLDVIPISPELRPQPKVDVVSGATYGQIDMGEVRVTIDVLGCSDQRKAAEDFAAFCASKDNEKLWQDKGFTLPREGAARLKDASAAQPGATLLLYAGAGLRPAVEKVIEAFRAKTGITVEADWGGSSIILSRLKVAKRGDLFMPGDEYHIGLLKKDTDLVASSAPVCYFVPVILVPKGNPAKIKSVADLVRPGVKLALGRADQCQIGRNSQQIFAKAGLDAEAIKANTVFESTTVNELGVQVQTGHVSATVVWDAVANYYKKDAETIAIPPEQNVISQVNIAALKCGKFPDQARQFVEFITGPEGKAILTANQYQTEPPK
ncbi:MAG: extracellular solute-binding protein [Planctomycetes bacterium]|nr:extracellular solute-binding protein [Planctomycetota bacterium]